MKAHGLNPRIRKSPFFASSLKYGATEFHPYNGMWMPVGYDTPINEYWNTVERAGLWDVAVQRCVQISGPDAESFTNLLTPRDVSNVNVGQCRYLVLTNQDGGIINDPVMLRIAEDKFWMSTADADMYLWAKGVATYSGHDVQIDTPHVYPMQIQGPASPSIVAAVFGDDILDLKYYHWMFGSVDDIDVVISRTGFSSEVGFEVYLLGRERGDELWEKIMSAGKPLGLSAGSPNRIRRVEGGVLDFGSDMTPDENPFEMGMERLIDFNKTDFIGKAALEKIRDEGAARKIVGVFVSGAPFEKNNEHRWTALRNGKQIGAVTQAVYSPRLERNIGFALLDATQINNDAGLTVDTPEGVRDLSITSMPFVDPDKKIPRASLR
ncbi:MAG: glycine cleavage T C-terminal barrel domain-containing protein [Pseudomonadota bacterium]